MTVMLAGGATLAGTRALKSATAVRAPIPPLRGAAAGSGHINFAPDPDGFYRRIADAHAAPATGSCRAFGLELLRVHLGAAPVSVTITPEG